MLQCGKVVHIGGTWGPDPHGLPIVSLGLLGLHGLHLGSFHGFHGILGLQLVLQYVGVLGILGHGVLWQVLPHHGPSLVEGNGPGLVALLAVGQLANASLEDPGPTASGRAMEDHIPRVQDWWILHPWNPLALHGLRGIGPGLHGLHGLAG